MYYADLSQYPNFNKIPRIDGPYAVGWLERNSPFSAGDVSSEFVDRLKVLCGRLDEYDMGVHACEWCDPSNAFESTGVICIQGPDLRWYAAPVMVAHYVEAHGYLPPQPFVDAVMDTRATISDWAAASQSDLDQIATWIGRMPKSVAAVAVRRAVGAPVVIRNEPILKVGKGFVPFPTLYWLVDPKLHSAIADVERRGGVREIEALLESDSQLLDAHLADNRDYARLRNLQLSWQDRELAEQQGFLDVLEQSGIGGVAKHAFVKCLHAQYAFHLARYQMGTTVGQLLEDRYGISFNL